MANLKIGHPIPEFTLPDLTGKLHASAGFAGKITLINFWSAECPWAEAADRALAQAFAAERWREGARWVSIASNGNEGLEEIQRATAERGLEIMLLDPDHCAADLLGAETTPHCFVLDEVGALRYWGGFNDQSFRQRVATRNYVIEAVEALLNGEQPPVEEFPPYGCTIVRFSSE